MTLNETAVKITKKLLNNFEECVLFAYPDPVSPLYKALSLHGMLEKYKTGAIRWATLPDNFKALSGAPWTCGVGETIGVTKDTAWTYEQAQAKLDARVRIVMSQVLEACPKLAEQSADRIAAITSLAYNIGSTAFKNSTACKQITAGLNNFVGDSIKMWNKAGGHIVQGLVNRRQTEANLWDSGR